MGGGIFVLIALAVIGFRVALHFLDKDRILSAASRKGWENVVVSWSPFAPGWFFEKGERHYLVTYLDENGKPGQRYCKTGLLTGVYWRDEAS